MYNVDKYFNFDNKPTVKSDKKKLQKQILLMVLLVGLGYYFFIYLPEEEKKEQWVICAVGSRLDKPDYY